MKNLYKKISRNAGIGQITLIAFGALLTSVIIVGTLTVLQSNRNNEVSLDNAIIDAIAESINREDINYNDIEITLRNSRFARGIDNFSGTNFFAIKTDGFWRALDVEGISYSCERMNGLGFPSSFIEDCDSAFKDTVAISDVLDKLIDPEKETFKIVGIVDISDAGICEECFTLVSDDDEITVKGDKDNLPDDGEEVIVTIQNPNTNTDTNTGDGEDENEDSDDVIVIAEDIDKVGGDEDDEDEYIPDNDSEDDTDNDNGGDDSDNNGNNEGEDEDETGDGIPDPGSGGDDYDDYDELDDNFFIENLYDRDLSDTVRIIND